MSRTGLAVATAADQTGRLLMYYQDPQGRVIENSYLNGWSLNESNVDASVVTANATNASPLSAISYLWNGHTYRQLFFINPSGVVMTTSSLTTLDGIATAWSVPISLPGEAAPANSIALAACFDHTLIKGVRLYYGSGDCIQEVGWQFNGNTGWFLGQCFDQSDPASGVACALINNSNYQGLDVYMRNKTTGAVQQNYYNFPYDDGWNDDGRM